MYAALTDSVTNRALLNWTDPVFMVVSVLLVLGKTDPSTLEDGIGTSELYFV